MSVCGSTCEAIFFCYTIDVINLQHVSVHNFRLISSSPPWRPETRGAMSSNYTATTTDQCLTHPTSGWQDEDVSSKNESIRNNTICHRLSTLHILSTRTTGQSMDLRPQRINPRICFALLTATTAFRPLCLASTLSGRHN